jgi:hypothetical protein
LTSFVKSFECDVLRIIKGGVKFQNVQVYSSLEFFQFYFLWFEKEIEGLEKKNVVWIIEFFKVLRGTKVSYRVLRLFVALCILWFQITSIPRKSFLYEILKTKT